MISESSTKVFSSPVYEVKKGSPSFHIRLDQYISLQGDIKVEFFNKPKMMRRVSYLMLFGTSWFVIQMCYTADVCVANKMECFESILNYHVEECG